MQLMYLLVSYLLCSERNAPVLHMAIKTTGGGSSFRFHYSKVLPELVLKQIWETSVFVK